MPSALERDCRALDAASALLRHPCPCEAEAAVAKLKDWLTGGGGRPKRDEQQEEVVTCSSEGFDCADYVTDPAPATSPALGGQPPPESLEDQMSLEERIEDLGVKEHGIGVPAVGRDDIGPSFDELSCGAVCENAQPDAQPYAQHTFEGNQPQCGGVESFFIGDVDSDGKHAICPSMVEPGGPPSVVVRPRWGDTFADETNEFGFLDGSEGVGTSLQGDLMTSMSGSEGTEANFEEAGKDTIGINSISEVAFVKEAAEPEVKQKALAKGDKVTVLKAFRAKNQRRDTPAGLKGVVHSTNKSEVVIFWDSPMANRGCGAAMVPRPLWPCLALGP